MCSWLFRSVRRVIAANRGARILIFSSLSGNWSVDIQAGASFGYRPMLFVIFLAGVMAIILQASLKLVQLTSFVWVLI